jgi:hypothetical protein
MDLASLCFESSSFIGAHAVCCLDAESISEDGLGLFNRQASGVGIAEDNEDSSNDYRSPYLALKKLQAELSHLQQIPA